MGRTVTIIRHAETNANRERRWQGSTDSGISTLGFEQIDRLRERFAGRLDADVVVSSDLPRTMATAAVLGEVTPDPRFREFSIGSWEGLTSAEVEQRYPDEWLSFVNGEDLAPGGGEQLSMFDRRIGDAFDDLVDKLADGQHAVLVTHGGVIWSIMRQIAGLDGRPSMTPSHNTAVSQISIGSDGERRIHTFNDATHLDHTTQQFGPVGLRATFIRHGQSEGNVAGTWDSTTDSPLTDLGRRQAAEAADHAPSVTAIFSSPRVRATQTATIIGQRIGVPSPTSDEDLAEMSFGAWEGLTTAQILEQHRDDIAEYESGSGDHTPRGGHGESLVGAGTRMRGAAERLAKAANADPYIAVSHGAAIRALAINVLGVANAGRGKIAIPRNTAQSSFLLTEHGAVMASYNVAPHLD
ncbi:MAG: histidine phosphatase family protein [Acidimicrobiia bacterium]